jgi:hypothetical protein
MVTRVSYSLLKRVKATLFLSRMGGTCNPLSSQGHLVRKGKDTTETTGQVFHLQTVVLQVGREQHRDWETIYQVSTRIWEFTGSRVRQAASLDSHQFPVWAAATGSTAESDLCRILRLLGQTQCLG